MALQTGTGAMVDINSRKMESLQGKEAKVAGVIHL